MNEPFPLQIASASLRSLVVLISMIIGTNAQALALLDQQGSSFVSGGYTGGNVVQSFTPSQSNIVGVDGHFYSFGGTQNVNVSVWDVGSYAGGGSFTGSALHTETLTGVSACTGANLMCHEFRWENNPTPLNPGELYYLQFTSASGALGAAVTNPYTGGATLFGGGNLFNGNADLAFRTYYTNAISTSPVLWLIGLPLLGLLARTRTTA